MNEKDKIRRSCIDCAAGACDGKNGTYLDFCLTCELLDSKDADGMIRETLDKYTNDPCDEGPRPGT